MRWLMPQPLSTPATWGAVRSFFGTFIGALYVLFALRELGVSPLLVGLSVGVGGISNPVGTLLVERITRRLGGAGRNDAHRDAGWQHSTISDCLPPSGPVPGFIALVSVGTVAGCHPPAVRCQ